MRSGSTVRETEAYILERLAPGASVPVAALAAPTAIRIPASPRLLSALNA